MTAAAAKREARWAGITLFLGVLLLTAADGTPPPFLAWSEGLAFAVAGSLIAWGSFTTRLGRLETDLKEFREQCVTKELFTAGHQTINQRLDHIDRKLDGGRP